MNAAVVAFTDPQGVFKKYETRVDESLKVLTNLHWRPSSRGTGEGAGPEAGASAATSPRSSGLKSVELLDAPRDADALTSAAVRTVPLLELQLTPEMGQRQPQHQIAGLNNAPLVQLLVLETAPLEIYRSKLRQIGKDWFKNQVQVRDPTGYVVVHSVLPSNTPKQVKAMWTRITSEFEPEHCIQLNPEVGSDWTRLRKLIKEQLLWAFSSRVDMLDSEIRKLKATRDIPGWNFGAMFVVHESLAWAYESMNLLDDALSIYELLERMLAENEWPRTRETAVPAGFIGAHNALVEPMLAQTTAHFDAYRHVIARQVALLLAMAAARRQHEEQVDSLADQMVQSGLRLALARLPTLLSSLNELTGRQSAYAWLLNVARELYARVTEIGSSKLVDGKGDLLLAERDALQALGLLKGYTIPGVFNDVQLDEDPRDGNEHLGGRELEIPELASEQAFRDEFVRLTKQAIEYFRVSDAKRAVVRLTGQLVLMEYHSNNYEGAWELLETCPRLQQLAPQEKSQAAMVGVALDCAEHLGKQSQVLELAWQVLSLMTYQQVPDKMVKRAVDLVQQLGASRALEHSADHWFDTRVEPYLRGDEKGYYLDLTLVPLHGQHAFITLDEAELVATVESDQGPAKSQVVFASRELQNADGGPVRLYTKHFIQGTLRLHKIELRSQKQTLVHLFTDVLIAMRPLATAFHAQITLAKTYSMRKRNLNMKLTSPRNIEHAKVQFQPIDLHLQLLLDKTEGLQTLANFTSAEVSVPALVDHDNPVSQLRVIIAYDDCTYEFRETVNFGLSVSVDFQEYFRTPPNVLSQFLVKPITSVPIVFCSADLTASRAYDVNEFALEHRRQEFLAFESAPVSYVFSLSKRTEPARTGSQEMHLSLTYRSLLWECQRILFDACVAALKKEGLQCYAPSVGSVAQQLSGHIDIEQYVTRGLAEVPLSAVAPYVAHEFEHMDPQHADRVAVLIREAIRDGLKSTGEDFSSLNATMELEVPNPDTELVHYVDVGLEEGPPQYVVGGSIPVQLKIETMAVQAHQDVKERLFAYELDRLSEGWSYTGKVKGVFRGADRVHERLHLIPNRSGELLLPNVLIRPVTEQEIDQDESEDSVEVLDAGDTVVVAKHANTRVLVIPETNMLAITF